MSSKDLKIRFDNQFCRMNCQIFSWPLSSGARGGSCKSEMLIGFCAVCGDREGIGLWGHAEICYRSRACGVHVKNIGCRRRVMHAVIRSYSGKGTKALFDLLEKNKPEVESLIRGVKGFVSYSLVRTTRGGFSVSVYQDKAGADESTRAAREWIAKNASKTGVARPTISEGTVMLQLK